MGTVLIQAGGTGKRIGSTIPKQFMEICGTPVIAYALCEFEAADSVDGIYIVAAPAYFTLVSRICSEYSISKFRGTVANGDTMFESTRNGIEAIAATGCPMDELVLIHEAARPLVSRDMVNDSFRVAALYGNAVAHIVCEDEAAAIEYGNTISTISARPGHAILMNPHTFKLGELLKAYRESDEEHGRNGAAMLMLSRGIRLHLSKGDCDCFKLTYQSDLKRFQDIIMSRQHICADGIKEEK